MCLFHQQTNICRTVGNVPAYVADHNSAGTHHLKKGKTTKTRTIQPGKQDVTVDVIFQQVDISFWAICKHADKFFRFEAKDSDETRVATLVCAIIRCVALYPPCDTSCAACVHRTCAPP